MASNLDLRKALTAIRRESLPAPTFPPVDPALVTRTLRAAARSRRRRSWLTVNCGGPGSGKPGPCPGPKDIPEDIKKMAIHLRRALKNRCDDTTGQCLTAVAALKDVLPDVEIYGGTYHGSRGKGGHYIAKKDKWFIDVTADQFGDSPIRVFHESKVPRAYKQLGGFSKSGDLEGSFDEDSHSLRSRITKSLQRRLSSTTNASNIGRVLNCGGPGSGRPGPCPDPTSGEDREGAERSYITLGEYLNNLLRSGKPLNSPDSDSEEDFESVVRDIDKAMTPITEPRTVYRGAKINRIPEVGETFVDRGYFSTSRKKSVAMKFKPKSDAPNADEGVTLDILLPRGTKVLDMKNSTEAETLLARGTKFKVLSKQKLTVGWRVKMEAVGTAPTTNAAGRGQFSSQRSPWRVTIRRLAPYLLDLMPDLTKGQAQGIARSIQLGLRSNASDGEVAEMIEEYGIEPERAALIARTEMARARADTELGNLRPNERVVYVLAPDACPKCVKVKRKYRERRLTAKQAQGIIPVHPNCYCRWKTVNVKSGREVTRNEWHSTDLLEFARMVENCGGPGSGKPGPCPDPSSGEESNKSNIAKVSNQHYQADFEHAGQKFTVNIFNVPVYDEYPGERSWGVVFGIGDRDTVMLEMSRTGKSGSAALGIFRRVGLAVDDFIKQVSPERLHFSAEKISPSRVRLYDRLAPMLAERHGYDLEVKGDNVENLYFLNKKKGTTRNQVLGDFLPLFDVTMNVFCATGEGGGVDPSCSPGPSREYAKIWLKQGFEMIGGTKDKTGRALKLIARDKTVSRFVGRESVIVDAPQIGSFQRLQIAFDHVFGGYRETEGADPEAHKPDSFRDGVEIDRKFAQWLGIQSGAQWKDNSVISLTRKS